MQASRRGPSWIIAQISAFLQGRVRPQRAAGMVEFALILPVLLYVTLGIVDFGRAFWHYNTLAEAVREGSRFATTHGTNSATPTGPGSSSYSAGPPSSDSRVTAEVRQFAFGLDPAAL